MTTLIETTRATFMTGTEVVRSHWSGERINSLRYTSSISAGLEAAFRDEIEEAGGRRAVFAAVNNVTPIMVALNELADIGESAYEMFKKGSDPHMNTIWLGVRSVLRQRVETERQRIARRYSEPEEAKRIINVLDTVGRDFILLSQIRDDFRDSPEKMEKHLNLDSAIIACGYIEAALPGILKRAGVNLYSSQRSGQTEMEYLTEKYKFFLQHLQPDFDPNHDFSRTQRSLLGMHIFEMGMKVIDDAHGREVDSATGVISFYDVVEKESERDRELNDERQIIAAIKNKSDEYFDLARKLGMSAIVMKTGSIARELSRGFKNARSARFAPFDDHEAAGFVADGNKITDGNLRHELYTAGLLGIYNRKRHNDNE